MLVSNQVVLTRKRVSESPGEFIKTQVLGPCPQRFPLSDSGVGPRKPAFSISTTRVILMHRQVWQTLTEEEWHTGTCWKLPLLTGPCGEAEELTQSLGDIKWQKGPVESSHT